MIFEEFLFAKMWQSLLEEVITLLLRYWLVIGLVAAVYFYW